MTALSFWRKIWVVVALPFFMGCQPKTQSTTPNTELKLHVRTAQVVKGEISDTLTVYGELALRQQAWIASQFEGRLSDFALLKGDKVRKGQKLGNIIPAHREALLQVSDSIANELRPLLEQQERIIPLVCPINGTVLDVLLHSGDVVSSGAHIARVANIQTLDVQAEIPVQYLPDLKKAGRLVVSFTNFEHEALYLPVEAIVAEVSENQTAIVRLKLDNHKGEYLPGMRVKVLLPLPSHSDALLVPRTSLVEEEGQFSVFVIENGRARKQAVTTGIMHDDFIEILSGVKENDRVAIEKAYSLKDNLEVIVK